MDTKRETALGRAWVLSATPGNLCWHRIVNVCLTPASSQAQLRCRVESMHWGPGPHPKRWSGGELHHVAATPSGPLAVAGDWIHSRQVGSAVAAARIPERIAAVSPRHCQAARTTHHPLLRSCIGAVGRHRKQHYTNTTHSQGFESLRLPQRRYSRSNSISLRRRPTTRTIIVLKLAPAAPPPPPPPTLPSPLRATTTRSRCHKSTPCPTTRYADINDPEPSDSLR